MKLSIITEAPWWYTLLCVLAGISYALLLYFREKRLNEVKRWLRFFMASLRCVVVSFLAFLLLSPLLKTTFRTVEKPVIVIAQDASGSLLMGKDSAFNKKEFPGKLQSLIDKLSDKYDVQTYAFGDRFREDTDFSYKDKLTNFSDLFEELDTRYSDRNLGAVIVASDGIYNEGQSPVYAAENVKVPLFIIALGDTTIRKDLILTKVVHNRIAFLGNTFPFDVVVDAKRCKGNTATLTVSKGGQTLVTKPVVIDEDPFDVTIPVELTANNVGLQHYVVALTVLDDESNVVNNTADVFIDVLDGRQKILIVGAAPHPDIGALKQSIEANDNYTVEAYSLSDFDKPVKPYSLAILHGLPATDVKGQKLVNDLVAAKIPIWYITGAKDNYTTFNALKTGVTIKVSLIKPNDCEPVPVKDFPLFNISEQSIDYFSKLPAAVSPFATFSTTASVTPLLKQKIGLLKTDFPLWVFSTQGDQKVSVFLGEGLWKWRLADFLDHGNHDFFNDIIGKTIQYLSVRDDKSFFRISTQTNFLENEPVTFDAEVYNQSYELINTPEVSLDITDEAGNKSHFTFSRTTNAYHLDARLQKVGQYKYDAKVMVGDKTYTQSGSFSVSPLMIETANSTADHQVLYNLASRHNGAMFTPDQLDKLFTTLDTRDDIKPVIYNPKKLVDLINLWWILWLLLGLLSLEWFIRKRNGAY